MAELCVIKLNKLDHANSPVVPTSGFWIILLLLAPVVAFFLAAPVVAFFLAAPVVAFFWATVVAFFWAAVVAFFWAAPVVNFSSQVSGW